MVAEEVVVKVENDVVHTVKKSRPLGSEAVTPFCASCEAVSWGAASSGVALRDREHGVSGPRLAIDRMLCG